MNDELYLKEKARKKWGRIEIQIILVDVGKDEVENTCNKFNKWKILNTRFKRY